MQLIVAFGNRLRGHIDLVKLTRPHIQGGAIIKDDGINITLCSTFLIEVGLHAQNIVSAIDSNNKVVTLPGYRDVCFSQPPIQSNTVIATGSSIGVAHTVAAIAHTKAVFIIAAATGEHIITRATIQHIIARLTIDRIVTIQTEQNIVIGVSVDGISTIRCAEGSRNNDAYGFLRIARQIGCLDKLIHRAAQKILVDGVIGVHAMNGLRKILQNILSLFRVSLGVIKQIVHHTTEITFPYAGGCVFLPAYFAKKGLQVTTS